MLVLRVFTFIDELNQFRTLTSKDNELKGQLKEHFTGRHAEEELSSNDVAFICSCYETRWLDNLGDENDVTLNPDGVNRSWVALAEDLAPQTVKKSYLHILIPTLKNSNDIDYNSISPLLGNVRLGTNRPENLFIGEDGTIGYTKNGFCDLLIHNGNKLGIYRDIHRTTLYPVTVGELARLKACKSKTAFDVDKIKYIGFWDYIERKVFTCLHASGHNPNNILIELREIIRGYFQCKSQVATFDLFKDQFNAFLANLYGRKLDNINFFYGQRVTHQGKQFYLIELLILIHNAQSYQLDPLMLDLTQWIRTKLQPINEFTETNPALPLACPNTQFSNCMATIVSLFTLPFDYFLFTGLTVTMWDKSNTVSSVAGQVYASLKPYLSSNELTGLLSTYDRVIKDKVIPACRGGFFSYRLTESWCKAVKEGNLSSLGVYWIEPERLLHGLVSPDFLKLGISTLAVNIFLNELITTYAQDANEWSKQIRVNIYFFHLVKGLNIDEKYKLIEYLDTVDRKIAVTDFIQNARTHLGRCLTSIDPKLVGAKLAQVTAKNPILGGPLFAHKPPSSVHQLIELIRKNLLEYESETTVVLFNKLLDFMISINKPFLSIEEAQSASSRVRTIEYINATS